MPSDKLNKYLILSTDKIRDAVKKMDIEDVQLLVVINRDKRAVGIFTMGDFRRAVFNGLDINEEVSKITNKDFLYLNKGFSRDEACRLFKDDKVNELPVRHDGKPDYIVHRKEIFTEYEINNGKSRINNIPVVIMAGGKGTRLDPFTRILPKPLIPLGNDPVIKVIMDEFGAFGVEDFHITLNEKGKMIKAYFHDHDLGYNIHYIEEGKPLGTAGSLKLFKGNVSNSFFVSNCDIIIKSDYNEILKFHNEEQYDLTIVGSTQQFKVPYGICDIENGGVLKCIREKPEYDFLVNTGLYIMKSHVLGFIPEDTYFDMTSLIGEVQDNGMKVGVFPVSEKAWIDVGQWAEYKNIIKKLEV